MAQSAFVKSFLPGLVLGVIVGAVAGAFLPPLLESREVFDEGMPQTAAERKAPTPEQIDEAQRQMQDRAAAEAAAGQNQANPAPSEATPAPDAATPTPEAN